MYISCKIAEDQDIQIEQETYTEDEKHYLCRFCNGMITSAAERITVNESHTHIFSNPHGFVFEIGCFKGAKGCFYFGEPSIEFAWFAGYSWQIAGCRSCKNHLGWYFSSESDFFFGLILDRLVFM
ncbi:MAG: cereblon family protein [Desulfobacteraceae bacterium]